MVKTRTIGSSPGNKHGSVFDFFFSVYSGKVSWVITAYGQRGCPDSAAMSGHQGGFRTFCGIAAQATKIRTHGAFKKGLYVEYVEIAEDDPWVDYFRQNTDRFPEIK